VLQWLDWLEAAGYVIGPLIETSATMSRGAHQSFQRFCRLCKGAKMRREGLTLESKPVKL
jgi:hypothetical protein